MQEPGVRDREIDPKKYYPSDMYREPQRNFPNGFKIDVRKSVRNFVRCRPNLPPSRRNSSNSSTSSTASEAGAIMRQRLVLPLSEGPYDDRDRSIPHASDKSLR